MTSTMANQTKLKLSIVVIGGGIGGLALAMFLRQDGHKVTVLERSDGSYATRSTGGIALFNNSTSIMKRRRLFDRTITPIADTGYDTAIFRYTGDLIANDKKTVPHSFVHRGDLSAKFAEVASELGADVRFNAIVTSLSESADKVSIALADGTHVESDIVVGADGINSFVRQQIFPDIKPQLTPCTVFLVHIPEKVMKEDPSTQELMETEPYHVTFGPERTIVSWNMTYRRAYHLQLCDYNYGNGEAYGTVDPPDSPLISMVTDISGLRKHWSDWGPRWRRIIDSTTEYAKWKIAEMPPMDSYTSSIGRIWLLGDACHAVKPFAGQGANMAFEDAESIATLLTNVASSDELSRAAQVYSKVRISRLAGLRTIIEGNVRRFGMADGEAQRKRDAKLKALDIEATASAELGKAQTPVNVLDRLSGEDGFTWLKEYNATTETLKAWSEETSKSVTVEKSML